MLTFAGRSVKCQPYVVPKIVAKNKDYVFSRDKRGNRFSVTFAMGSFTSCATDAEAAVTDAMDVLVANLKENISRGLTANGETRKKRKKMWYFYPFNRKVTLDKLAEYEMEVLNKPNKFYRKSGELKDRVALWRKSWLKNNKWNRGVYLPPSVSDAPNAAPGNWTGLLVDSIQRSKVTIRQKDGNTPNRVTCRISVAPTRAEYVKNSKIMSLKNDSATAKEVNQIILDYATETHVMNAWTVRSATITKAQIAQAQLKARKRYNKAMMKLVKALARQIGKDVTGGML